MSMKLLGAALLITACVTIGFIRIQALKRHKETLSALSESLQLMKNELATRLTTLPALMHFLAESSRGETKDFFESLNISMNELGEREFASIWISTARQKLISLNTDELNRLYALGRLLGQSEVDAQLSALAGCQSFMDKSLEELRAEYPQLCRLAMAVPAAAGLMLVIVLV